MPSFYGPSPFHMKTDCQSSHKRKFYLRLNPDKYVCMCNPPVSLPPIGQSDHNSVLLSFNNGTTKYGCSKLKIRQGNNHNKRAFENWLAGINWICSVLIHVTTS